MNSKPALLDLSEELLLQISINLGDNKADLLQLRTVCRRLHTIVGDQHWHEIILTNVNAQKWRRQLARELECDWSSIDNVEQALENKPLYPPPNSLRRCLSMVRVLTTEIQNCCEEVDNCISLSYDVSRFLVPLMTGLRTISAHDERLGCPRRHPTLSAQHIGATTTVCALLDNLPQSVENLRLSYQSMFYPQDRGPWPHSPSHWCVSLAKVLSRLKCVYIHRLPICSEIFRDRHQGGYKHLQELQITMLSAGGVGHHFDKRFYLNRCEDGPSVITENEEDGLLSCVDAATAMMPKAESLTIFRINTSRLAAPRQLIIYTLDFVNKVTIAYPYTNGRDTDRGYDVLRYQEEQNSKTFDLDLHQGSPVDVRWLITGAAWERPSRARPWSLVVSHTRRRKLLAHHLETHGHAVLVDEIEPSLTKPGVFYLLWVEFLDSIRIPKWSDCYFL